MIRLLERAFPAWAPSPIKGVSISSSGILALANLTIIANRTVLTGTSTWFDIFVLVPGLYIQPSSDDRSIEITRLDTGETSGLTNPSTSQYLKRISEKGNPARRIVIVDVSSGRSRHSYRGRIVGRRGQILEYDQPPASHVSDFFYAPVPLLTIAAIILMILAEDWWGLSTILCLIIARILTVWVIRARTAVVPAPSQKPNNHACWWVSLGDDRWLCLRGLCHDLEAFTQGTWMRPKTKVEEGMEGAATLIVFLIAVVSDNSTQIGAFILIALLLASAGLLALSNAYAVTFHMNGRTAYPHLQPASVDNASQTSAVPTLSALSHKEGDETVANNPVQQQEAKVVLQSTYPLDDEINYV